MTVNDLIVILNSVPGLQGSTLQTPQDGRQKPLR